jgi:hypothetical protein
MDRSPVFEQTYLRYLAEMYDLDLERRAGVLGAEWDGGGLRIPLFGRSHVVGSAGMESPGGGRPIHSVCVVLAKYVLGCPDSVPAGGGDWVTYKDFKDAAPFVGGFVNNSERALAVHFGGRIRELSRACDELGGFDPELRLSYELVRRFDALPRVPLVLLYNDADEEFPAESTILFERRAERFLDMECLAILGWLLADELKAIAGDSTQTIM